MSGEITKELLTKEFNTPKFKDWLIKRRWFANKGKFLDAKFEILLSEYSLLDKNIALLVLKISKKDYIKSYFTPFVIFFDLNEILESNERNQIEIDQLEKDAYSGEIRIIEAEFFKKYWRLLLYSDHIKNGLQLFVNFKSITKNSNFHLEQLGKGNTTNMVFQLYFEDTKVKYILKSYKIFEKNLETEKLSLLKKNGYKNVPEIIGRINFRNIDVISVMKHIESTGNIGEVYWNELNTFIFKLIAEKNSKTSLSKDTHKLNSMIEQYCSLSLYFSRIIADNLQALHNNLIFNDDPNYNIENINFRSYFLNFTEKINGLIQIVDDHLNHTAIEQNDLYSETKRLLKNIPELINQLIKKKNLQEIKIQPIHQDLHMEQILYKEDDNKYILYFLDFEGDPQRPYEEKIKKNPIEKDYASFLRSFSYIRLNTFLNFITNTQKQKNLSIIPPEILCSVVLNQDSQWSKYKKIAEVLNFWEKKLSRIILKTSPVNNSLINLFSIERILNELNYEILYRPKQLFIPILSLKTIINGL
ncbi:MAG: hypothetical protein ACFFAS_13755 [Promethearchaeota archaeon]